MQSGGWKAAGECRQSCAFTLLELLVVFSVLTMLLAILLPSLSSARERARTATCGSNIRQLAIANDQYTLEYGGVYAPGASDYLENLNRWHGERTALTEPFDSAHGPLASWLGPDGAIRACPSFEPDTPGFEIGNGGYGYNNAYIGVQTTSGKKGQANVASDLAGAYAARVTRPADTVMFADAGFVNNGLIEYSFVEPRFHPQFPTFRADPSTHFRHAKLGNVAWCDGHVSRQRRTFTWSSGLYRGKPGRFNVGWFGQVDDNSLFDLR